jgi:hypothetical protein
MSISLRVLLFAFALGALPVDVASAQSWESLGGVLNSGPKCVSWGPNRIDCFARGADNAMNHRWWDGTDWRGWESLGGNIPTKPECVSWGPNRIDCFARGTDNAMHHRWWDGTAWGGWENLGGQITSDISCTAWGVNRIDCFARGADNAMLHRWWDGAAWRGWESLGGIITTKPECVSWGPNRIDCFARGTDNAMHHRWWDGTAWGGWEYLGGQITSDISCTAWGPNRIDCFARGTDNAMHHRWWDGTAWKGWVNLGRHILTRPECVSWAVERINCFAKGTDNAMHHRWWDGSQWLGWQNLGGYYLSSDISCTTWSFRIDCFARFTDNAMHHRWWNGYFWKPGPAGATAPPQTTSIQRQGPHGETWKITALGPQSAADADKWLSAGQLGGVLGSDFRGPQEIGSAPFMREARADYIPDNLIMWVPLKRPNEQRYVKRSLAGVVADDVSKNHDGKTYYLSKRPRIYRSYAEYRVHDLNIDIFPFPDYSYLITEGHRPVKGLEEKIKDAVKDGGNPCTEFIRVEAEIDAPEDALKKIVASLNPPDLANGRLDPKSRVGKPIAVYGPWVYDRGHCHQPEIHPAEQIWWTVGGVYHLNVFADASGRFSWRWQMAGDDPLRKLRPWAAPPIIGTFAIAFEVAIDPVRMAAPVGKRFEVADVGFTNAAHFPNANTVQSLDYNGTTLVSFVPKGDKLKASFANVGLKPGTNNIVRGFLVLETNVGSIRQIAGTPGADPDKVRESQDGWFEKKPGHYMFTVTRTDIGSEGGGLLIP